MRAELGDRLCQTNVQRLRMRPHFLERELTPLSIIAILSARRAVESRCVMNTTVFVRFPSVSREICSTVSKKCFWACASSDDVCAAGKQTKKPRSAEAPSNGARVC